MRVADTVMLFSHAGDLSIVHQPRGCAGLQLAVLRD
jgi:hypothetical protein